MPPRKPPHPAIVALRAAHSEFAATLTVKHSCFDTDLAHDERAIRKFTERAFVWVISHYGTSLIRITDDLGSCYAALRSDPTHEPTIVGIRNVLDAFTDADRRMFVWDGHKLRQYASRDTMVAVVCDIIRSRVISHMCDRRVIASEDLAIAMEWGDPSIAQRYLAGIDQEISEARTWGAP